MTGIAAAGGYVPRLEITAETYHEATGRFRARGLEATTVPDADEDPLTMGYEAGRRAIDAADCDPADVDWLGFASSRPPMDEGELSAHLASMLGVETAAETVEFRASTRAGTRAIAAGCDALEARAEVERALVVAADAPRGAPRSALEHAAGAGAGALVLTSDGATTIEARSSETRPTHGTRYRPAGEDESRALGITEHDRSIRRDLARAVLEHLPDRAIDTAVLQAPDGDTPYRVARSLGLEEVALALPTVTAGIGDVGAASVPLNLAATLSTDDGGHGLLLGWGDGGAADGFLIDARQTPPVNLVPWLFDRSRRRPLEHAAMRARRNVESGAAPEGGGAYVSIPNWVAGLSHRYGMRAGRCPDCEAVRFPPGAPCGECGGSAEATPVALSRTGVIQARTSVARGGAPPEFVPYQEAVGAYDVVIATFETPAGEDVSMPCMFTADGDEPAIGDPVRATIRRLYTQERVTRYGIKVIPKS